MNQKSLKKSDNSTVSTFSNSGNDFTVNWIPTLTNVIFHWILWSPIMFKIKLLIIEITS